jgi:hypothetical protein
VIKYPNQASFKRIYFSVFSYILVDAIYANCYFVFMSDEHLKKLLELKKQELLKKIDYLQSNVAAIDSAIDVFKNLPKITNPEEIRLREMILTAIKSAPQEFTLRDIEMSIAAQCIAGQETPKVSIASSFWKIVNEELKYPIVQKGEGRRPTIYRKP